MQTILDNGMNGVSAPSALALGNFDGVHVGHQYLIKQMLAAAGKKSLTSIVCTFSPHPEQYYGREPRMISTPGQKLALLEDLGVDYCFQALFDEQFAALPPLRFLEDYLLKRLQGRIIVVGEDFKFGQNRRGNGELLKTFCGERGLELILIPPVKRHGTAVSSTLIRQLVASAKISEVPAYLGRYFSCVGTVEHGQKLGTQIGFPTANLKLESMLTPPDGIYAGFTDLEGERYLSMIYIGRRPTVAENAERRFEVHVIDYGRDLYQKRMEVFLTSFIRKDKKFSSVDDLKNQIRHDRQTVTALNILS